MHGSWGNWVDLQDVLKHVVEVQYTVLEVAIIQLQHTMENGVLEISQTFSDVIQTLVQVNHLITYIELHILHVRGLGIYYTCTSISRSKTLYIIQNCMKIICLQIENGIPITFFFRHLVMYEKGYVFSKQTVTV